MNLYHYYDKSIGPFVNLFDLSINEAEIILKDIKNNKPNVQSAKRQDT